MDEQKKNWFTSFASLHWYDETIRFVFQFVAKTSELLLAAGVVVSTANFLTDGDIMGHNKGLSDAWSWAQALAIDSSLGIVFMSGFQAVKDRDKVKAAIFFTLTAILATVAGLLTHFDALSHAAGLPVTDKDVSGIIPLWILTALRAIAVVGFLLVSRLKNVSFNELRREPGTEPRQETQEPPVPQIDYSELATAIVGAMQKAGATLHTDIVEERATEVPLLESGATPDTSSIKEGASTGTIQDEPAEVRIAHAYEMIKVEREQNQESKPISARELAKLANVRRSTCSEWLEKNGITQNAEV